MSPMIQALSSLDLTYLRTLFLFFFNLCPPPALSLVYLICVTPIILFHAVLASFRWVNFLSDIVYISAVMIGYLA